MNKGFKKPEMHLFSAIEGRSMSSNSNCTTDSDGSSLASLELQLFEDVNASMRQLNVGSGAIAPCFKQAKNRDIQKVHCK